jgi:hypothetical protein
MLGRIVKRRRGHVYLLYDLSNSTTLTRKIVVSLVLPIIKILAIKDHKIYYTFFHAVFGSQSLLKPTSDQTGSDNN